MGNKFNSFGDYGYVESTAFEAKTYEVSISENDKIISVTENGSLLATVKLGLDNQTLSLIGKDGKEFSSVVLPSASVVESARYDEEKQALILTIKLADGTTKEIEISFTDMLDDYAKKEDVEKNTQAIKDEATTRAEADAKFTEKDIQIENTISTLDDRLTAKDAEIDEALTKKVDLTEVEYEGSTRKAIVLGNHDTILGTTTSGGTVNVAMVSKWDKVDLGSKSVEINLNGHADRPTYNDSEKLSFVKDIDNLKTNVDNTIQELKDKDSDLQRQINLISGAEGELTKELEALKAKDVVLENKDAELEQSIEEEKSIRSEKDTELQGNIEAEASERIKQIEEINEKLDKKVEWTDVSTEENPNRKSIVLENHDTILGKDTNGGTVNIAMVSKWNKVDLGSAKLEINLNGSAEHPTYNDSEKLAFVSDITSSSETISKEIEDLKNKDIKLEEKITNEITDRENTDELIQEELTNLKDKAVQWTDIHTEENPNRKSIVLENHDCILGKGTKGGTVNIAMISKWDKVDLGTTSLPINLNTPKGVRPTVQEAGQTGEEANKIAYLSDVSTLEETLEDYAKKDHNHDDVYSKLDHTHDKYATKDEVASDLSNKVDWTDISTEDNADRKAIVLKNNDMILGKSSNGGTVNIAMVNKWNIVDLGTTSLPINLNTPKGVRPTVQEAGQSGEEANEIAYLTEIIGLNVTDNLLASKIAVLEEKLEKLSKTDVENVELNGESEATFSGESKDYIISGEETKSTAITGKTVKLDNLSISNNARTTINASDVEIKNVNISGDFPKANDNAVVKINNAEYVVVRDMIFDSSNVYNGIEIGLSSETLPKSVLFENCQFLGKFSNNAILVFGTQDNAVVNINNCYFKDLSNAIRLSNNANKSCTLNITNCKFDKWETKAPYQGMIIMEDYTSKSNEEAISNNLFGDNKITINIINCIGPNNKKITAPTDLSTICGTGDDKQIIYVYYDNGGLVAYDKSKYPIINIM